MSFLGGAKTFFEKVGEEIEKLFGKAPAVEQQILAVVKLAAPIIVGIVGMLDPAAAPLVAGIIGTAQSDLATVSVIAQQGAVAPGTPAASAVSQALNSLVKNLPGILQIAEVKNSAKAATITNDVTMLTGEFQAVLSALTPPSGPIVAPTPIATPAAGTVAATVTD